MFKPLNFFNSRNLFIKITIIVSFKYVYKIIYIFFDCFGNVILKHYVGSEPAPSRKKEYTYAAACNDRKKQEDRKND